MVYSTWYMGVSKKKWAFGLFPEVVGHSFTYCWGPGTHSMLLGLGSVAL